MVRMAVPDCQKPQRSQSVDWFTVRCPHHPDRQVRQPFSPLLLLTTTPLHDPVDMPPSSYDSRKSSWEVLHTSQLSWLLRPPGKALSSVALNTSCEHVFEQRLSHQLADGVLDRGWVAE
ncbi:hypothetical protein NDU88_005976 [Pleurodeles waltl]|uniref:Uncharacterized protein n=1 Tax=Pleurodeles waltl TaxID=8319 RepID=A0AAV7UKI9_PLEWA|nr:hypothetical protein NDU88_005976 [Pleurodeles waltl]